MKQAPYIRVVNGTRYKLWGSYCYKAMADAVADRIHKVDGHKAVVVKHDLDDYMGAYTVYYDGDSHLRSVAQLP